MNINISVQNKVPILQGNPIIMCGNSDYTITFTFDSEWDNETAKTARFVYGNRMNPLKCQDVPFTGNTVEVPVLVNVTEVYVGVYTDNLRTTAPARIPCQRSIRCLADAPEAPSPDVYDQIIALFNATSESKEDKVHFVNVENNFDVTGWQGCYECGSFPTGSSVGFWDDADKTSESVLLIHFKWSTDTGATFSAPNYTKFYGTDCENGVFTPDENGKFYDITICWAIDHYEVIVMGM